MNILIAIDSFKGSLSSEELSITIEEGLQEVSDKYSINKLPIADGGEGTMDALLAGDGGNKIHVKVKGPLFEEISAEYGVLPDKTVVLEMASAAGLSLVPSDLRNPLNTSTIGVGQIIFDAISKGHRKFIVGIGGSATNDGGIGMLSALGHKFIDSDRNILKPIGSSLNKIAGIDSSGIIPELKESTFTIACDVNNPLYGPNGAAKVYAKQKGASYEEVEILDLGLKNYAKIINNELNMDISNIPGSGAAGGLGGGFKAFLNAKLKPGIEIIFDQVGLDEKVKWADVVITGEGRLDHQTAMGKVVAGVAQLGQKHNKKVIALAGSISKITNNLHELGITSMFSTMDKNMSLEEAMKPDNAKRMVKKKVVEIFRLIQSAMETA